MSQFLHAKMVGNECDTQAGYGRWAEDASSTHVRRGLRCKTFLLWFGPMRRQASGASSTPKATDGIRVRQSGSVSPSICAATKGAATRIDRLHASTRMIRPASFE